MLTADKLGAKLNMGMTGLRKIATMINPNERTIVKRESDIQFALQCCIASYIGQITRLSLSLVDRTLLNPATSSSKLHSNSKLNSWSTK